jgi:hypothetical protein
MGSHIKLNVHVIYSYLCLVYILTLTVHISIKIIVILILILMCVPTLKNTMDVFQLTTNCCIPAIYPVQGLMMG